MTKKEVFKRKCPNCKTPDKIISRCRKCSLLVCISCSIQGYCADCYINVKVEEEINHYFGSYEQPKKIKVEL